MLNFSVFTALTDLRYKQYKCSSSFYLPELYIFVQWVYTNEVILQLDLETFVLACDQEAEFTCWCKVVSEPHDSLCHNLN